MVSRLFFGVIRRLFFNSRLRGSANLRTGEPVIMVANHVGSFGPVSVITSVPVPMRPWVAHEVTDPRTVARRIQAEFLEQELHLRPPLSEWLGRAIGRICVAIMRDIGAIPVYAKSRRLRATVQESIELLQEGQNILVFAEDSTRRLNDVLCEFCTGFIHVAREYYERTRRAVQFLPVAVNRRVGAILVGRPIRFDAARPFPDEKQRLKEELQRSVFTLYQELESGVPARRTRTA